MIKMQNTQLTQILMKYLRENKVFEGQPITKRTETEMVPVMFPQAGWDEYCMVEPYWQYKPVVKPENAVEAFEAVKAGLRQTSYDDVQERALKEIPDSDKTAIIELGSRYGIEGAGFLAKHKPNARVILISAPVTEPSEPRYLFNLIPDLKHRLVFEEGINLIFTEPNIEKRTNALYKANGIENVEFHEHELTFDQASRQNLPDFLKGLEGKDIYLFGHQSPTNLPFIIGKLFNELGAKQMSISLTAPDKTRPEAVAWQIVKEQLGLTDQELQGYIASTFDPIAESPEKTREKYEYTIPGEERMGKMLKLGLALALAKQATGEVLWNSDCERYRVNGFNKIDYYVEAERC
jgi:hypothetical protein